MRLKISKLSAEEAILDVMNKGYRLAPQIYDDYVARRDGGDFNKGRDVGQYRSCLDLWFNEARHTLLSIFPTDLEENFFSEMFSVSAASYRNMDAEVGAMIYVKIPTYLDRLHRVLEVHLRRYSDLPLKERLVVEDIDSFMKVRDVNPSMISSLLQGGRVELSENEVQLALEAILDVPFHKKDWGGEVNDLYTANIVLNGVRRPTAFMLKGNGLKRNEMSIGDCGKNGDQLVRLFSSPAELFVIQYVGPIAESVIADVHGKTIMRRSQGANANYLIIDGQDTARLLFAYNKLPSITTSM